ncbi:hypothetical protein AJ78_08856 [Emergomyces pasteurianus Ep9510]|uniref:Fe2OG dioxygenase domain-containing protein n=1 Tax=Emergomyces pasteurianus Ep9510 TaxID=1447872 RepID=A0A1J9Q1T4_9EURO|nr:hypothetical protein AJ78_08856 [Emergomyces pasteurianus Ep9510]
MFPTSLLSQNLPNLPSRKALLILDLQNDFVKPEGALFVRNVPDFLDTVSLLAQRFRESGEVIWVQTQFEHRRPIFRPESGGEVIVVDKLPPSNINPTNKKKKKKKNNNNNNNNNTNGSNDDNDNKNNGGSSDNNRPNDDDDDDDNNKDEEEAGQEEGDNAGFNGGRRVRGAIGLPRASANRPPQQQQQQQQQTTSGAGSLREQPSTYSDDPEAFLSVLPKDGGARRCCLQKTVGCQFPAPILSAMDHDRDTILVKSDYSAFQSESLLLSFRTQFVRELYICGSLSNVSVYATALDAVSHGLDVTLVEDCLGFRSFARHEEAMRRMADMMGVNGITSKELSEEQDWEEAAVPTSEWPEQSAASTAAGIEDEMDVLAVKSPPKQAPLPTPGEVDRLQPDDAPLLGAGGEPEDTDFDIELLRRTALGHSASRSPKSTRSGGTTTTTTTAAATTSTTTNADPKIKSGRPRIRKPRRTVSRDETNNSDRPQSQRQSQRQSLDISASTGDATRAPHQAKKNKHAQSDLLGPDDSIGEGDSRIIYDLSLSPNTFQLLREEVNWQKMYHMSGQVPRLVAVQGAVKSDNSIPIYRHPADESPPLLPFSKTVNAVRQVVEKHLGHPLNHVLIQLYRDGQDRISEHSDKTLDIVRGSYICNVSLGAQRTMTLRTKSSAKAGLPSTDAAAAAADTCETISKEGSIGRQTQKVPLPHNSLFILGEETNMRWLHAIRADKRPESEKSPEELAFGGQRISLTFRHIGTFIHPETDTIWGQGAVSKAKEAAGKVIHGNSAETERMIRAFGQENQQSEFDWEHHYGQGFDVVNFVTTSAGKLLPCGDDVADLRVKICFAENGVRYELAGVDDFPSALRGTLSLPVKNTNLEPRPVYMDMDGATCFTGDDCILLHVAKHKELADPERQQSQSQSRPKSPGSSPSPNRPGTGGPPQDQHQHHQQQQQQQQQHEKKTQEQMQQQHLASKLRETDELLHSWRRFQKLKTPHGVLQKMDTFEAMLRGKSYLAGQLFGIEDCALWPVVWDIIREVGPLDETRFPSLMAYYHKVGKRACVRAALEELAAAERG